jgi:adenylate cyclase
VMATFPDETTAALGAVEMLTAFESLRRHDAVAGRTSLKVGAFAGSGFVATANNIIDYFGQTVNIAARLQGEAKPGQLVLTEPIALELVRKGRLTEAQVVDRYDAKLKGVDGALRVARVQVTPG